MLRTTIPLIAPPLLAIAAFGATPSPPESGSSSEVGARSRSADAAISARGELLPDTTGVGVARYTAHLHNNGTTVLQHPAISATAVEHGSPLCDVSSIEPGETATCTIQASPTAAEIVTGTVVRDVIVTTSQPSGASLVRVAFSVAVPLQPDETIDPTDPVDPGEPGEPGGPEEPGGPGNPGGPDGPGGPANPGAPDRPGGSGQPGDGGHSGQADGQPGTDSGWLERRAALAGDVGDQMSDLDPTAGGDASADDGIGGTATVDTRTLLMPVADEATSRQTRQPTALMPFAGSSAIDGVVLGTVLAAAGAGILTARLRPRSGLHRG